MFSPLGRSTTSCCMRSLRAPILSSTLSFSSTAPVAYPVPYLCSFTNSAIPVSCQPNHYSQVISRRYPLKVGVSQSMLVRKLSSADEGKREESEAEKKRSAQLSQVHSVTFYHLLFVLPSSKACFVRWLSSWNTTWVKFWLPRSTLSMTPSITTKSSLRIIYEVFYWIL